MPYISVKTNKDISNLKDELKTQLGSAISAIPGKSEAWLMVEIQDKGDMYFKGSDAPCVMFDVSVFGSASDSAYDELTKILCALSQELLGISGDRTYVKYAEVEHWGYNSFNF